MQAFTRMEFAINETLSLIATDLGRGALVSLDHAMGARHENFREAIGPGGPFEREGAHVRKQFEAWRELEARHRNWIVHSYIRIAFDAQRQWQVKGDYVSWLKKSPKRDPRVVCRSDALAIAEELELLAVALGCALGQFRKSVRAA